MRQKERPGRGGGKGIDQPSLPCFSTPVEGKLPEAENRGVWSPMHLGSSCRQGAKTWVLVKVEFAAIRNGNGHPCP